MHLISSLLFALSANIDSFIVGMSYGIRKHDITLSRSLLISFVTALGTIAAILTGTEISRFLPGSLAQTVGCTLLIGLGLYYILKSLFSNFCQRHKKPEEPDTLSSTSPEKADNQKKLTLKGEFFLGLMLSINNFGMGIGASITGLKLIPTAILSLLVSTAFLYSGNLFGKQKVPQIPDCLADVISGLILIGLGAYELLI